MSGSERHWKFQYLAWQRGVIDSLSFILSLYVVNITLSGQRISATHCYGCYSKEERALSNVFFTVFMFLCLLDLGLRFTDIASTHLFFVSVASGFPFCTKHN